MIINNKDLGVENEFSDGLEEVLLNVGHAEREQTGLVDSLQSVEHGEDVGGVGGVDVVLAHPAREDATVQAESLQLWSQQGRPDDFPSW